MPLFSAKFSTKKVPGRKSNSISTLFREDSANGQEDGIQLRLGEQLARFNESNGKWDITQGSSSSVQANKGEVDNEDLQQQRQKRWIEENYLLKLKIEILTEMLTQRLESFQFVANE